VLCACLAALTAIVLAIAPVWKETSPQSSVDIVPPPADIQAEIVDASVVSHPIYRYSVIPGGVHDPQDVLDAVGRDPVVADHYRDIALDRVRVERLTEERHAYVSYRVGDRVFWTKHRVTLPAGEAILTDGVKQIRARCGNCIAYEPQLPTSDAEPDVLEFEALAPPAHETIPSRAAAQGSVPSAVTPIGQTASSNLVPSPPRGVGEPGSRPVSNGTSPVNGIPITEARRKSVVQQLPNGYAPGYNPGDFTPGGSIADGLIPTDSIAGSFLPDGQTPDGPSHPSLDTPFPGTLIPPGGDEFGEDEWTREDPIQPVPVPEPSTMVLVGTGVAGALWRRVRSRRTR
jgi:hypothetical protein